MGGRRCVSYRRVSAEKFAKLAVATNDGSRRAAAHLCGPLSVTKIAKERSLTPHAIGGSNGGAASKQVADARAETLAPTICQLRAAGVVSLTAIAKELNRQQVPTARSGKPWYPTTVARLLSRLGWYHSRSRLDDRRGRGSPAIDEPATTEGARGEGASQEKRLPPWKFLGTFRQRLSKRRSYIAAISFARSRV
jgi:hypothetical protein